MQKEVTREHVKMWLAIKADVRSENRGGIWIASVEFRERHYCAAETIEKAYKELADKIYEDDDIMPELFEQESFRDLVKRN